jgi:hypothetical protein
VGIRAAFPFEIWVFTIIYAAIKQRTTTFQGQGI